MNPLLEAARELQALLDTLNAPWCFTGLMAMLRWGKPQHWRGVEVAVLNAPGAEDEISAPVLKAGYTGRVPNAAEFARRKRILTVSSRKAVPADIVLVDLPFHAAAIERATSFDFSKDCALRTCSAEDLIVLQLLTFKSQELTDAESVVARQHATLDWDYLSQTLAALPDPETSAALLRTLQDLKTLRSVP